MRKERVFLIGIDGATWDLIDEFIDQGALKTFRKLKSEGSFGTLLSTIPPLSPPAWTSIFTGVNPGKHGILSFTKRKENSYFITPLLSFDKKSQAIWDMLKGTGIKGVFLNIPFSFPPSEIDGVLISGLGVPSKDSDYIYPKEFKSKILNLFPGYQPDFDEEVLINLSKKEIRDKVERVTNTQIEAFKYFIENGSGQLFVVVFRSLDMIQHYFFKDKDVLLQFYTQLDNFLSWLIRNLSEEDSLFVCSDHGFTAVTARVYFNEILKDLNYYVLKDKKSTDGLKFLPSAEVVYKLISKLGLRKLIWRLKRSSISEVILKHIFRSVELDYIFKTDWKKTYAYFLESSAGMINLNLKGREPEGLVTKANFHSFRRELIEKIKEVKDPETGEKLIFDIHPAEEVITQEVFAEPDIIFYGNPKYTFAGGLAKEGKFIVPEAERVGDHAREGIFLAYGLGIKSERIETKSLYDIAPTVLYSLGLAVPEDLDGKPITEIFKEVPKESKKQISKNSFDSGQKRILSRDEEEKILKRLEGLGYL